MHCRHIILPTLHFQEYINTKTLKISFDITYMCSSSLTACAQHGAESSSLRIVIGISHCKHFQHNLHTLFVQQIKPFLSVNRVYFHFDMPKYTQNRAVWLSACSSALTHCDSKIVGTYWVVGGGYLRRQGKYAGSPQLAGLQRTSRNKTVPRSSGWTRGWVLPDTERGCTQHTEHSHWRRDLHSPDQWTRTATLRSDK